MPDYDPDITDPEGADPDEGFEHVPADHTQIEERCVKCGQHWPCEVKVLEMALERMTVERDTWRESYALSKGMTVAGLLAWHDQHRRRS